MSPDESPAIHGTERDDFCAMFNAGDIYLFYAPKRSGKTTASLLFAWWGSKHHNYRIVSNIVLRRRDPKKFEGKGGWKHVYHTEGYDYVDNYYDLMCVVEDFLRKRGLLERPNLDAPQKLMFILDEATTSAIRMGQTTLNPLVQAAIGLAANSGHWAMVTIILTQAQELISAKFRGIEQGLITGFLTKQPVPGYDTHEIVHFRLQDPDQPFKKNGKDVNLKDFPLYLGPLEGWARTPDMIRKPDGSYLDVVIFDTEASATFDTGKWPLSAGARAGKQFDVQGIIRLMGGAMSEDLPVLLRKYLDGEIGGPPDREGQEIGLEPEEDEDDEGEEPEDEAPMPMVPQPKRKKRTEPEVPSDVPRGEKIVDDLKRYLIAHQNDEIARLSGQQVANRFMDETGHTHCTRQRVNQIRLELRASGQLTP